MSAPQLLTASRLRTARSCRRRHHYRYGLMVGPLVEEEVLRFGTLMHQGLEPWWLDWAGDQEQRLELALAAFDLKNVDPFERAKARAMMMGYHHRWKDEPYEAIGVESEFETDLRNPETGAASRTWKLGGKIDVRLRHIPTSVILGMEHKTSGEDIRPGSNYYKRLRLDSQLSVYFDGARALGDDLQGFIYDVLGKPGLRPYKATPVEDRKYTKPTKAEPIPRLYANQREADETPDEYEARCLAAIAEEPEAYFQRVEVVRLEKEIRDAQLDTWQLAQELREAENAGRHPRNPDACVTYSRVCEFFDVCTGAASLDDPTRFVKRETAHPELSQTQRAVNDDSSAEATADPAS